VPTLLLVDGEHYKYLQGKTPSQYLYLPLGKSGKVAHIGRRPSADMDLHHDEGVSQHHASIRVVPASAADGKGGGGHFELCEVEDPDKPAGRRWPKHGVRVATPGGWQRLIPGKMVVLNNRDEVMLGLTTVVVVLDDDFPIVSGDADRAAREAIVAQRKAAGLRDARSASRMPDAAHGRTFP